MTHTVEPQALDIAAEAASYARRDHRMLINGQLVGAELTAQQDKYMSRGPFMPRWQRFWTAP
jgi:hypothetical protein